MATPRPARAQTPVRRLDVTGSLLGTPTRPLSLGAAARDPLAFDPLSVMGFRPGRDVDWSRVPATRLLGGLLGALVAHRGRLSIRSEFLEGEGGRFSAGVVSNRRVGSGVGLTWSY